MITRVQFLPLLACTVLALAGLTQSISAQTLRGSGDDGVAPQPRLVHIQTTGYKATPVSIQSKKGQRIFADLNCAACHSIHNVGGTLGPVLDGIGARRNSDYLQAKFCDTEEAKKRYAELTQANDNNLFSHVRISKDSSDSIVAFLLTLPEPSGGFIVEGHSHLPAEQPPVNTAFKPAATTSSSEAGAKLYSDLGCMACHSIGNNGGWLGPQMDGIGGRRSRDYIVAHITNPKAHTGRLRTSEVEVISQMPKLNITDEQMQKIADFLETLPNQPTQH
jgi:cytochrome c2